MRSTNALVVVVIGSLLVAAIALAPRRDEQVAVLADEGRHREAVAILESRLRDAPGDPDLLAAAGRSYAALGDVERAISALDAYLAVRPNDLPARKRQADLLRQSGAIDRYLSASARVASAEPSAAQVTRLVELYRLHGRFEDEIATLQTYAGGGVLEFQQLERLGASLAERANWADARRWLELADRRAPPEATAGRLLLLEVLLQSKDAAHAYRRVQVWMTAWGSPFLSGRLISRMAQSGSFDQASRLARQSVDKRPQDTFDIVGLLASKGLDDLARRMLARWAERAVKPNPGQLHAFVQASAMVADLQGPLVKLAKLARGGAPPEFQGQMAEHIVSAFGSPALTPIRAVLPNAALLARPLLAAELSLFEGNIEAARRYLDRVDLAALSAAQMEHWLALLHRATPVAEVFERLALLWNKGRLPAELAIRFADEAAKAGQPGVHDLVWKSIRSSAGDRP